MKDTDYVYAVGRIRVNELSLLSSSDIRRLASAHSYEEAISSLNSRGYDIQNGDYSAALKKQKDNAWLLIKEVLPDISQMDSLIVKNDFHNLKAAVKAVVSGMNGEEFLISPSVYNPTDVYEKVLSQKFGELPELLSASAESAYDILVKTNSAQLSDAVLDKASLEASIELAKKADSPVFSRIAQCIAACTDIKVVYRCLLANKTKSFMEHAVCSCDAFSADDIISKALSGIEDFLSYLDKTDYSGASEALRISSTAFEKYCDDALMNIIEHGKMTAFGIDPIVAYYVAKEAEILSVRIILSGKLNNVSEDVINERVRKLYV